jgi:hypothetical protein
MAEEAATRHSALIEKLSTGYKGIFEAYKSKINDLEQKLQQKVDISGAITAEVPKIQEKSLGAREREILLKIVIGMAIKGYAHMPHDGRTTTAREIASDLRLEGIPLDEDTIRKYLNEAKELLPAPETERKS